MKEITRTDLPLRALIIGLAAIAPVAFPAAQAGYTTLHDLAYLAIIPAAVLLVLAWAVLRKSYAAGLAASIRDGAVAGALATVALEAVRYSGFRIGFMPGNLPELMCSCSTVSLWAQLLRPLSAVLLIIFGTVPASESSSPLGVSICRVGGRFPTGPLWASVSSSVPWSRDWALAFSASTLDGTSLQRSSPPILHSVRRWPRRSGAIEFATPNVQ